MNVALYVFCWLACGWVGASLMLRACLWEFGEVDRDVYALALPFVASGPVGLMGAVLAMGAVRSAHQDLPPKFALRLFGIRDGGAK